MVRQATVDAVDPTFGNMRIDEDNRFFSFHLCTEEEIKNVILNSPPKTCLLDNIPTDILKKFHVLFLPFLTSFVNLCLQSGKFPSKCKHAIVVPLLKKPDLDKDVIANYRPVANLSFISKIIERVVVRGLIEHLNKNNLLPQFQSGYRHRHSTETALLQVVSGLFANIDLQNVSLLAFLDMSAAFDCVDHRILLTRLERNFGLSGVVALWFESYLTNRTQQVLYDNKLSDVQIMSYGVLQGSVLGPVLFLLYTAEVFSIIEIFGLIGHAFADDIQIIVSSSPECFNDALQIYVQCLLEIETWMSSNRLKLNQNKTQLLPIGTFGSNYQKLKLCLLRLETVILSFVMKHLT